MISTETARDRQEEKDWRREQQVKMLKKLWKTMCIERRVMLIRDFPDLAQALWKLVDSEQESEKTYVEMAGDFLYESENRWNPENYAELLELFRLQGIECIDETQD